MDTPVFEPLPVPPSQLGESPFWHPDDSALYWCDIPGRTLNCWHPGRAQHRQWAFDTEPACAAPLPGGALLLGMRDGLFRFDPATGERTRLAAPPYDPAEERFNDGKADPQGRFWAGTIYEPRTAPKAALYRWAGGKLDRVAGDITTSNGLAWRPDGRTLYWSDTKAHVVRAFDVDPLDGSLSRGREFARFAPRGDGQPLETYGGRPDGAAMDIDGGYWVAMFEGQRLLRLAADGSVTRDLRLPVRCPTMPCFGGADGRTLFVTTARQGRPADELAAQPLAGCVLSLRVDVPGLPVNFARP
ncbi:SMP-30/gluconolactonase/LRE family protein [Rubrivivax albus]|uniref:SMP-30/gluconolactonase/LRE family protein n=1 Tax=Rubrivivax albus TaxID=2499835 RepID=A0A437JWB7_9BURK|nr:SMP-30/gluconolactonase/LRE family protein [Rubrivivax albus]RVT51657.1 SMP-30/gluconolactonase/LRE family protein [Rubrivivax albus]